MNQIPNIMIGSFKIPSQNVMNDMISSAIENNCLGFDTSPSYGTEHALGVAINRALISQQKRREDIFVSDKIDGIQMQKYKGRVRECVKESLMKVRCDYFDLVLIHWPFMEYLDNTWYELSNLRKEGIINYIGICNVNEKKLNEIFSLIGENPQVIQNEISPLNYDYDVEIFKRKGIIVEAYSPLGRMIKPIRCSEILNKIALKHNKNVGQIILKWHIQRGIIPIFTSTDNNRIKSNLQINDFKLDEEDMANIRNMDKKYKIFPYSYGCPGY